jgi:hypothetical protein
MEDEENQPTSKCNQTSGNSAFAIAAHKMTDPIGANANAAMTKIASTYHTHGNLLCGLPFITAIRKS